MKVHIIKNGVVINTIISTVADAKSAYPGDVCVEAETGGVGWLFDGSTFTAPPVPEKTPEQLREIAKAARAVAVENITVTTQAGNTFDGDETAHRRMTSAITAMNDTDMLPWVLQDDSIMMVSKEELTEALRLAGMQMASIWITPYTG